MKKITVPIVICFFLVASLVVAIPAFAANEFVFDADTLIDLSSPDVNLTILDNSQVDSMTTGAGSITFTVSTGANLTVRSTDRKALSHSATSLAVGYTCTDSYSEMSLSNISASGSTLTITASGDICTPSGSSGGGGGGGSVSTPTTTTTETTEEETTDTEETTTEEATEETTEEAATEETTEDAATEGDTERAATEETTTEATTEFTEKITTINSEAADVITGEAETLAVKMGTTRNVEAEQKTITTYIESLTSDTEADTGKKQVMANFVLYGTETTKKLGAGERAGVLNSFKKSFSKLPETATDWQDAIKIANGRFPSQQSIQQEKEALKIFGKIYKKMPDFSNPHDEAALKIITYGLRPTDRNLDSEKFAIKVFENIYGEKPATTEDWDIMRAIAYSGATR